MKTRSVFVDFLNFLAMALAIVSFFIGIGCLFLVHCECCFLAKIGRRMFVAALLALGVFGLLAALVRHEGLAPLGLLAGLLIVAMLCEFPSREIERQTAP
jgi:hypothetical protein